MSMTGSFLRLKSSSSKESPSRKDINMIKRFIKSNDEEGLFVYVCSMIRQGKLLSSSSKGMLFNLLKLKNVSTKSLRSLDNVISDASRSIISEKS